MGVPFGVAAVLQHDWCNRLSQIQAGLALPDPVGFVPLRAGAGAQQRVHPVQQLVLRAVVLHAAFADVGRDRPRL